MIKIKALHHISISVSNLEKSKQFYEKILNLKELPRPNFGFNGAWYDLGEQQLHLIVQEPKEKPSVIDTTDPHIALRVEDYEQTVQILKENKIPHQENPGTKSGFVQVFCMDPDMNLIELNVDRKD